MDLPRLRSLHWCPGGGDRGLGGTGLLVLRPGGPRNGTKEAGPKRTGSNEEWKSGKNEQKSGHEWTACVKRTCSLFFLRIRIFRYLDRLHTKHYKTRNIMEYPFGQTSSESSHRPSRAYPYWPGSCPYSSCEFVSAYLLRTVSLKV